MWILLPPLKTFPISSTNSSKTSNPSKLVSLLTSMPLDLNFHRHSH
jgi:hypothetical protein